MKWLIFGILSSILFGFWGLFDKLSSNLDPFVSGIIIYLAAIVIAIIMILFSREIKFSRYSFISGIFAGVGNFFVLYALLYNKLILVLPFVSLSGAAFFLITYFTEKPNYTKKQKHLVFIGLILSIIGIITVSSGSVGLFNLLRSWTSSYSYILPAIVILIGFTFWTYFTYKSVSKEKINPSSYCFWAIFGSLITAVVGAIVLKPQVFTQIIESNLSNYIYPILGGISLAVGAFFTYFAFKTTTTKTKLQEAMVAILANGELIPLLFLSYFILGEWVPEGFFGVILVLFGLIFIHYAEVSK